MDLFQFINTMFRPEEFAKIKMHERAKHYFMVTRLCSIQFPLQASYFNHIKINPAQAVTFWQQLLSAKWNRTPGWMYVKTRKEREQKKALQPVSEETIRRYCEVHKLSRRQVDDAMEILGERMHEDLKNFEQLIQQ